MCILFATVDHFNVPLSHVNTQPIKPSVVEGDNRIRPLVEYGITRGTAPNAPIEQYHQRPGHLFTLPSEQLSSAALRTLTSSHCRSSHFPHSALSHYRTAVVLRSFIPTVEAGRGILSTHSPGYNVTPRTGYRYTTSSWERPAPAGCH